MNDDMKRALIIALSLCVLMVCLIALVGQAQTRKPTKAQPKANPAAVSTAKKPANKTASKTARKTGAQAEFAALLALPVAERIARLQAFIETKPPAELQARAVEHLVSAHAALGDEKLGAGDTAGGVEEFKQAVAVAPVGMSDKLFVEVVAQFPANLFLRGQGTAAFEVARLIEAKVKDNAQRLVALADFYLNVEQADEAARLADAARTLAPDLAAAHQALGAARRLTFRLDEATDEYRRALELDPKSALSRRNLADLLRAQGKPEDALALYRAQLGTDAKDKLAQTGVVLSLFDAGQREEAERELTAALTDEPRNLLLLVGAAYWYAAHGEAARALELVGRAVQLEPRYTWAQIVAARALVAQQRASDAERALRFAREYGRFPTLDYELASALAAAGLYEEAAEELAHTFTLKDGQLETQLAGRVPARATNFIELLAPERRASIFQAAAADTDANARMLKGLLALYLALNADGAAASATNNVSDAALDAAARDFIASDDEMRAFRQLYAADRLARRGLALATALELAEAAKGGVERAAETPVASVAVAADELRLMRARALNAGGTPDFPVVPRDALLKILRGRTEELVGWALFNQGKTDEAVTALRRAVSVLPVNSLYWRNAQWRLGTALAASGQQREALAAYVKGYDRGSPDPTRRGIIATLYTKVNGSLSGLDALIGPAGTQISSTNTNANTPPANDAANSAPPAQASDPPMPPPSATTAPQAVATPKADEPPAPKVEPDAPPVKVSEPPAPAPQSSPVEPAITPTPSPTPTPAEATPTPTPVGTPTPIEPAPTEAKPVESAPGETKPAETEATPPPAAARARRAITSACALALSVDSLLLTSNGGTSALTASLEGPGATAADITASTINWAAIIILREPQDPAPNAARYTISSVSKQSGTFVVTFKSPCGTKEVAVTVK